MNEVFNVLIAEPVRIVAEDIAAEIRSVSEEAIIRLIQPAAACEVFAADLLIWGWEMETAELSARFRALASKARHVVVTASVEPADWEFPVLYVPFPARPEVVRQVVRDAMEIV